MPAGRSSADGDQGAGRPARPTGRAPPRSRGRRRPRPPRPRRRSSRRATDRQRRSVPLGSCTGHGEPLERRRANGARDLGDAELSKTRHGSQPREVGVDEHPLELRQPVVERAPRGSAACARIRWPDVSALPRSDDTRPARRVSGGRLRRTSRQEPSTTIPSRISQIPTAEEDPGGRDRVLALALRRLPRAPRRDADAEHARHRRRLPPRAARGRSGPRMPAKKPSTSRKAPTT